MQLVNKAIICKELHSIKWQKAFLSFSLSLSLSPSVFKKQEKPETELCILFNYNEQIVLKSLDLISPTFFFFFFKKCLVAFDSFIMVIFAYLQ